MSHGSDWRRVGLGSGRACFQPFPFARLGWPMQRWTLIDRCDLRRARHLCFDALGDRLEFIASFASWHVLIERQLVRLDNHRWQKSRERDSFRRRCDGVGRRGTARMVRWCRSILLRDFAKLRDQLADGMIRTDLIQSFVLSGFSELTFELHVGNLAKDNLDGKGKQRQCSSTCRRCIARVRFRRSWRISQRSVCYG